MTARCPTCGQSIAQPATLARMVAHLPPYELRLYHRMEAAAAPLPIDAMIRAIYGRTEPGRDPAGVVRVTVHRLRRKLAP